MTQTWNDLLFAHWRVDPDIIRNKIPSCLDIDTYEGISWVGIIPFELTHLRARFLPPMPFAQSFPELNLRTYVTHKWKPGVYFFSLDVEDHLAVFGARTFFHLPYFYAQMVVVKKREQIQYYSKRKDSKGPEVEFKASYYPTSEPFLSKKGTLDYWLTERYRLYTTYKNQLYYEDIHHKPWLLQNAEAIIHRNTIATPHKIALPQTKPLLHYAKRQKVLFWPLKRSRYDSKL